MDYPIRVTINLEINADGTINARDADGKILSEVDVSLIRSLYQREGGVRHIGELLYDDRAAAGACCLYQYIGGRWVCVKTC